MKTTKYAEYLTTDYWKAVSDAVKKRDGYRCRLCNSQHDLCAHHRTYDHRGKEMDFLGDLTTLCRRCHEIFHGKVVVEQVALPPPMRMKKEKGKNKGYKNQPIDYAEVERDMPPGVGDIIMTHILLGNLRGKRGGFTNAAIRPLGVPIPLMSGWPSRLIGTAVPREKYRRALEGRYQYNTGRLQ
jgi:hypothetical protein